MERLTDLRSSEGRPERGQTSQYKRFSVLIRRTNGTIISGLSVTGSQNQVVFQVAMKKSHVGQTNAAGVNFDKSGEL
jgi:hypothetical protein